MRIATNVNALNSWRNLSITNNSLSKTLEKLSSGYRINRAADDAAGLAISEKMRGQIAGLNMAVKNAQDSISLIQTAEGGLNEVHAMLKRMEELAVQSANDTNTADDRAKLQTEMDRLAEEVARIGSTTEFNTKALLNGKFDGVFHIGANENQNLSFSVGDMRSFALGIAGDAGISETVNITVSSMADLSDGTYTIQKDASGNYEMIDGNGTVVASSADGVDWDSQTGSGNDSWSFATAVISGTVTVSNSGQAITGTAIVTNDGLEAGVYTYDSSLGALVDQNQQVVALESATAGQFEVDGVAVLALSGSPADGTEIVVGGIDISSQTAANEAITAIQAAVNEVSAQRSDLGALQNRLEHTINNLQVAAENLSAAESRIRDVDMAAEMANFTRHQILLQAGTAMLAQANAAPQSVLQLLG